MGTSTVKAGWIAAAGLTVLSSAAVAALTLTAGSTTVAATAALPYSSALTTDAGTVDAGRVVASYRTAPTPVSISFRAPVTPAAPAPRVAAARRANPLCQGAGWEARRGAATIERLRRPADARAVPVSFRAGRPDVLGMADLQARRVDVYVRSCVKQSDALLLHVVAHELGHLVDAIRLNDDLRTRWKAARGIPASTPWFGCSRCSDFATPAGDFAETYAQWQRGASTNRSQLAPAPSRAQLASLARTFFSPL